MKVAISIDWDFFFDDTHYDWGHREAPFFIEPMWSMRATDFKIAGKDYRDYSPKGVDEFLHMLKTLQIAMPAVYVSESHLHAIELYSAFPPDLLINFDTHPDMSPKHPDWLDCENWLYWLLKRKRKMWAIWVVPTHAYIPKQGDNIDYLPTFTYINYAAFAEYWSRLREPTLMLGYTCRSGAWTPPWADQQFDDFVKTIAPKTIYHHGKRLEQRKFSVASDEQVADIHKKMESIKWAEPEGNAAAKNAEENQPT